MGCEDVQWAQVVEGARLASLYGKLQRATASGDPTAIALATAAFGRGDPVEYHRDHYAMHFRYQTAILQLSGRSGPRLSELASAMGILGFPEYRTRLPADITRLAVSCDDAYTWLIYKESVDPNHVIAAQLKYLCDSSWTKDYANQLPLMAPRPKEISSALSVFLEGLPELGELTNLVDVPARSPLPNVSLVDPYLLHANWSREPDAMTLVCGAAGYYTPAAIQRAVRLYDLPAIMESEHLAACEADGSLTYLQRIAACTWANSPVNVAQAVSKRIAGAKEWVGVDVEFALLTRLKLHQAYRTISERLLPRAKEILSELTLEECCPTKWSRRKCARVVHELRTGTGMASSDFINRATANVKCEPSDMGKAKPRIVIALGDHHAMMDAAISKALERAWCEMFGASTIKGKSKPHVMTEIATCCMHNRAPGSWVLEADYGSFDSTQGLMQYFETEYLLEPMYALFQTLPQFEHFWCYMEGVMQYGRKQQCVWEVKAWTPELRRAYIKMAFMVLRESGSKFTSWLNQVVNWIWNVLFFTRTLTSFTYSITQMLDDMQRETTAYYSAAAGLIPPNGAFDGSIVAHWSNPTYAQMLARPAPQHVPVPEHLLHVEIPGWQPWFSRAFFENDEGVVWSILQKSWKEGDDSYQLVVNVSKLQVAEYRGTLTARARAHGADLKLIAHDIELGKQAIALFCGVNIFFGTSTVGWCPQPQRGLTNTACRIVDNAEMLNRLDRVGFAARQRFTIDTALIFATRANMAFSCPVLSETYARHARCWAARAGGDVTGEVARDVSDLMVYGASVPVPAEGHSVATVVETLCNTNHMLACYTQAGLTTITPADLAAHGLAWMEVGTLPEPRAAPWWMQP